MESFSKIAEAWQLIIQAEELMNKAINEIVNLTDDTEIKDTEIKDETKEAKETPQMRYYKKHKEEILKKEKEKYNTDEEKKKKKEYYQQNKEKLKEKQKQRYQSKKVIKNSDSNIYNGSSEPNK